MTGPWPPSSSSHFGVPRHCRKKSLNTVHKGHWFQEHSAWKAQPLPLRFDYGKNGVRQLGGDGSERWKGKQRNPRWQVSSFQNTRSHRSEPHPCSHPTFRNDPQGTGPAMPTPPNTSKRKGLGISPKLDTAPKAADVIQLSVLTRDWGNRVLSLWSLGHDMLLPPGVDKK